MGILDKSKKLSRMNCIKLADISLCRLLKRRNRTQFSMETAMRTTAVINSLIVQRGVNMPNTQVDQKAMAARENMS